MPEQVDLAILRRLAVVSAQINHGQRLDDTLQAVADGVVEALGFGAAAVNYVLGNGDLQVLAVAGPREARLALSGVVLAREMMDGLLARSEAWGDLRYVAYDPVATDDSLSWVPTVVVPAIPDAWHPDDVLLAPLCASDGTMLGVLSVDLPPGQRRPSLLLRELLEMFAMQAGLAIDRARLDERLRDEHARLLASEAAFRFSFSASAGPMATIRLHSTEIGRLEQTNAAFCRAIGYRADELAGRSWVDLVVPAQRAAAEVNLSTLAAGEQDFDRDERQVIRKNGSLMWAEITSTVIAPDAHAPPFVLIHLDDITERKAREDLLVRQAQVDPLTGLANRRVLLKHLRGVLAQVGAGSTSGFILYADLDRFKRINDHYGHGTGDAVLREVADRLRAQVRLSDIVARLGGDEFVIVAADLDAVGASLLVDRIHAAFREPLTTVSETVTISLGVAAFAASGGDGEALLDLADQDMYADKLCRP